MSEFRRSWHRISFLTKKMIGFEDEMAATNTTNLLKVLPGRRMFFRVLRNLEVDQKSSTNTQTNSLVDRTLFGFVDQRIDSLKASMGTYLSGTFRNEIIAQRTKYPTELIHKFNFSNWNHDIRFIGILQRVSFWEIWF